MSPESTSALSVSSGLHGGATVIRAVGDLDYDYAPVFRRQLTELWATAPIPDANTAHVTTSPTPDAHPVHTTPPAPGAGVSHITTQTHSAAPAHIATTPHVVNTAHAASTTHPTETIHAAGAVHLPETTHLPEATRPTETPHTTDTAHIADAAHVTDTPHTTDTTHTADMDAPGISRLVIDLSGLTFCDSTGLAELLWVLQRSRETGTRLMLAGTNRTLRHMLTTTGLLSFFELADSVEEALERR
ncbi:STAS domain-containing protein [Streptosporangium saharense]|uniref:STAS domain-containing protein n=1 Tax=Streptosporangium saharense TaxID=1706840 RepID=UPI0036C9D074